MAVAVSGRRRHQEWLEFCVGMIAPQDRTLFYDAPFFGLGTGIRTRNENLIFGTIELKFIYYPRTVEDINSFRVSISTRLRVKYSASFVKPPSLISYN